MAEKDKFQKNAEQEGTGGTGGTKEPNQSTAEFYSMENAPTIEDSTSGRKEGDHRQEHEDEQAAAAARDGEGSVFQGSSETKVPESSDVGSSLLNPPDPQAGRLGDRVDDLGLRPDYTSPNVFDDAADAGGPGGYAGMGKGLISETDTAGGIAYGAGYDSEEGLKSTGDAPSGDNWLYDLAESFSKAFVPGEGPGPTNEEFQRLEQEESGGKGEDAPPGTAPDTGSKQPAGGEQPTINDYENEDGTTTTVVKNADGTTTVLKGDNQTTLHPDGTVTERNTATGETTKTSPNVGIPDDENEGGGLPPGFIDGDALLPSELRTESILQNMTGAGSKGGEEVNPTPEGGTGQSGGTATDDAFSGLKGQTTQDLIGQPDPDATQHGGKSPGSEPTFGPGQEEINPGEDGKLPPGETRSEDLPGGTTSSQDDSLGLEGGSDGEFDLTDAAKQIQDSLNPPELPPGFLHEDDPTDELDITHAAEQIQDAHNSPELPSPELLPSFLDTTDEFDRTQWAEQIQDALNPPVLPPEPLDPTDDAGF